MVALLSSSSFAWSCSPLPLVLIGVMALTLPCRCCPHYVSAHAMLAVAGLSMALVVSSVGLSCCSALQPEARRLRAVGLLVPARPWCRLADVFL
mmetsp:Transcript_40726/g.95656  ORF Transcript_40726/g.95656 Transcript_40726/m.95656 type:complete len:94 (-) Transcript_40726:1175-1456(-)